MSVHDKYPKCVHVCMRAHVCRHVHVYLCLISLIGVGSRIRLAQGIMWRENMYQFLLIKQVPALIQETTCGIIFDTITNSVTQPLLSQTNS